MLLPEIRTRVERSHRLFEELVTTIPGPSFGERLPGLPSNTIGDQLWCVVGARESYARAIEEGEWRGFTCSLSAEGVTRREALLDALRSSGVAFLSALDSQIPELVNPGGAGPGLILDCLEHEASHQGQMIRYLYALELPIPASWQARYALRDTR